MIHRRMAAQIIPGSGARFCQMPPKWKGADRHRNTRLFPDHRHHDAARRLDQQHFVADRRVAIRFGLRDLSDHLVRQHVQVDRAR